MKKRKKILKKNLKILQARLQLDYSCLINHKEDRGRERGKELIMYFKILKNISK